MKTLRFLAIMLTALSMGTAYAHLLEMPAKLSYDGETWLQLLQTLYPPAFGTVGGASEIGAVIATIVLVLMIRKRRDAFRWSILAAACLIGSHAIYWIFIAPVNSTLVPLTAETLPENWSSLRDQWEYSHTTRAILQIVALASLVLSVLGETQGSVSREQED